MAEQDTIDRYLDELVSELSVPASDLRRIVRESEEHLRESVDALRTGGMSLSEARLDAIGRFGTPAEVAGRFNAVYPANSLASSVIAMGHRILALGSAVMLAIGLSGLIVAGLAGLGGQAFVVDPVTPGVYGPERCSDFFGFYPNSASCEEAAASHHYDELLDYRAAAGVMGLAGLLAWFGLRRRGPRLLRDDALPPLLLPGMAVGLFAVVAPILLFMSVAEGVLTGGDGSGESLANGLSSVIFLVASALAFIIVARSKGQKIPV